MLTEKFGRPVTTCVKVLDMTGLKLSALSQMKVCFMLFFLKFHKIFSITSVVSGNIGWHDFCQYGLQMLTSISTVDDLNYPEKTETYYVVNVPYIFSACWKVYDLF